MSAPVIPNGLALTVQRRCAYWTVAVMASVLEGYANVKKVGEERTVMSVHATHIVLNMANAEMESVNAALAGKETIAPLLTT